MIGGGPGAFIGPVHRMAARLDDRFELVAAALASDPDRSRQAGLALGLPDDRAYGSWREMLERERDRPDRADLVVVVTPNDSHYPIARAFCEAGFNLLVDKPLCHTVDQARQLVALARRQEIIAAVAFNYCMYPMVRQARELVATGRLGTIRKVVVEYHQGWLSEPLEQTGHKQAAWREDPARAGPAGAIADIGSHAEQLLRFVTGLQPRSLCAELHTFVAGRPLDDDANVLLRLDDGARAVLVASQVCAGSGNDLRLRVWGDRGGLAWHQEQPDQLTFLPASGPAQLFRPGQTGLCGSVQRTVRLPIGHPEAFVEALANLYRELADALLRRSEGSVGNGSEPLQFPTFADGARSVAFVEAVLASARAGGRWVDVPAD